MKDIVLLHGAIGAGEQLLPIENFLKEHGFRCFNFTLPGHGKNNSDEFSFSIDDFAKALIQFIQEKNLSQVYLFGYSMGGYVALVASLQQPALFRAIATLGTKFDWSIESAATEVKKLNADKIIEKVPHFATMLANRHGNENWKNVLKNTADLMLQLGEKPIINPQVCAAVSMPVLIMVAEHDDMVDKHFSRQIATSLPKGKFQILPQAYHPIEKVSVTDLGEQLMAFFTYL
jgi:alpha-beta hydrolase superfamily lysophospholipase